MTDSSDTNYQNNPLHGVGLKQMLEELVTQYGFQILYAYLNINCFKTNPSIMASVKFLKKTDWAREKVEVFYLYRYKNLPRPSSEQFKLSPRDRVIPPHQQPGEPAELSLEDAEREREKREQKAADFRPNKPRFPRSDKGYYEKRHAEKSHGSSPYGERRSSNERRPRPATPADSSDPWAVSRKKHNND